MLASATYLKIKNVFLLPRFVFRVMKVSRQVKRSDGLLHFSLKQKGILKYYTLTVWKNKDSMYNFRDNGEHLKVMKTINQLSNEYSFTNWETNLMPEWSIVFNRLNEVNQKK